MIAGVRWIATPLASLTNKMERVGKGDFSSDLKIHANDELGQLAGAVNQMCDRLRQQQANDRKRNAPTDRRNRTIASCGSIKNRWPARRWFCS